MTLKELRARALVREITLVLCVKIALLSVLWWTFFRGPEPEVAIESVLLGPPAVTKPGAASVGAIP